MAALASQDVATDGEALRLLVRLAWPSTVTLLCRAGMLLTDLSVIGHVGGTDLLAAASVALVYMAVTGALIDRGISAPLVTLCSQSFGANHLALVGMWLQLGLLIGSLALVPIAVAWWYTEAVLLAAGMGAELAARASVFARYSILWLYPQTWFDAVASYFQAQGIVLPTAAVNAVFVAVNLGFNLLFVSRWGLAGSALATFASRVGQLVTFVLYTVVWRRMHRATWPGWTTSSLACARVKAFVGLAVPMLIGGVLEEWQLQVLSLFAAKLSDLDIATHNAILGVFFFVTAAQYGTSNAIQVRCAYYLGAGSPARARHSVWIAFTRMAVPMGVVVSAGFMIFRNYVGRIFSNDPEVWRLAARVCWYAGGGYAMIAAFYVSMATLNAQARPGVVAAAFLTGAWIVCVPLGYALAFPAGMGLEGLWVALVVGYTVTTAIAGIAVLRSDWNRISQEAVNRSHHAAHVETEMMAASGAPELMLSPAGEPDPSSFTVGDDRDQVVLAEEGDDDDDEFLEAFDRFE